LLRGVVNDDLPAVVGVFEDQREEAFGVAAVFFAAFKMVFADDDGEVFVKRMDLEVGVGEGAHGGFGGIVVFVLVEQAGETARDLAGDEDCVGGVLEASGEGREVALVPRILLGDEDLDDVELLAAGGVERVWLLRGKEGWCKEGESESGEAERRTKRHEGSRGRAGWFGVAVKVCCIGRVSGPVGLIVDDQNADGKRLCRVAG
jgi:hypothetical protein